MNLAKGYAHALYDLEREGNLDADTAVSKLVQILKAKGHIRLLPSILSEYKETLEISRDKKTVILTCARESDFEKYRIELKEHLGHLNSDFTEEVVDDTIIGGYILQKEDSVIDASFKKKLLLLYQGATA